MTTRTLGTVAAVVAGAVLLAAACSDPQAPAAPTPVAPTITDTYTGTLLVGGTNTHPFTVNAIGGVSVTLTSAQPAAALGIGIGSTTTGGCTVLSRVTVVPGTAAQLVGTATVAGNFCLSVIDVGNLVEPVTYTVSVFHS